MRFERSGGVLLHVSSLASAGDIGDMGPAAYEFVAFLAAARQHVWQVLPLGPTGYGNSPYASSSAFAGNSYLISLEVLADWGWIDRQRLQELPGAGGAVDFEAVEARKLPLLYEAAGNFLDRGPESGGLWGEFESFCRAQAGWLEDYALYAQARRVFGTGAWTEWPEPMRRRESETLKAFTAEHGRPLGQEQALQFAFARQWDALRSRAVASGIRVLGDIAIFVNMDSADVWVHPELFELDAELHPVRVAGVPPDYFSATGQRWGNPLYRWDVLEQKGYDWWIARVARARELYDIVRLDHFRGFEAYWSIPASEPTAVNGQWMKGPGIGLFRAMEQALGELPLVAEDLGVITPEVDALRLELGYPGMKVIQFGFSDKGAHMHLPHQYAAETVAYTGTHDNDTTAGWWRTTDAQARAAAEAYVGPVKGKPAWPLLRAVSASAAELAIAPAQDLLELGSEGRMNTPAVPTGNWSWRATEGCWGGSEGASLAERLAALAEVADRNNDPLGSS
jgi:4-alpha-glucanotransferase